MRRNATQPVVEVNVVVSELMQQGEEEKCFGQVAVDGDLWRPTRPDAVVAPFAFTASRNGNADRVIANLFNDVREGGFG